MAVIEPNQLFYTEFEPKLKNRFIFYVEGIPTFLIRSGARPQHQFNTLDIHHINVVRRVKGKIQPYPPISFTLYDPIAPSGSQVVMEWFRLHHDAVTGRDNYADVYKRDVTFNTLDPVGAQIEEWTLKNAWISNVDLQDVSWDNDALQEITLELTYDYPIQQF